MSLVKLKNLLILVLILLINDVVISQDTVFISQNNSMNIGIENRFVKTVSFGLQRMISSRDFIIVNAAIQSKSPYNSYNHEQIGPFFVVFNKNKVFTSKSISVGYGRFIIPKSGLYLSGEFRYQNRYFDNVYFYQCTGMSSDSEVSLLSEHHNNIGITPVVGYRLVLVKGKKLSFISDFNYGQSIGISIQENLIHGEAKGSCNPNSEYMKYYPTPIVNNKTVAWFHSVIRIKVGIIF